MSDKQKLVVIGNGMAPGRMLEDLFDKAPDAYDAVSYTHLTLPTKA